MLTRVKFINYWVDKLERWRAKDNLPTPAIFPACILEATLLRLRRATHEHAYETL